MSGFVKIDEGILTSSLWVERDLRSIFLTALFMAEPYELEAPAEAYHVRSLDKTGFVVPPGWYGFVRAAGVAIVRLDGCDKEVGLAKLEELCAPDPESRSDAFEGRRMARINGGYLILNYMQYRDRDYTAADRMRRLRQRRKGLTPDVTANSDDVTPNVTQAESREQRAESNTPPQHAREELRTSGDRLLDRLPAEFREDFFTLVDLWPATGLSALAAEIGALLDGMHGPRVPPLAMGQAIRDYTAAFPKMPSLKHFRAFVQSAVRGEQPRESGERKRGQTLKAANLISKLRKKRLQNFPQAVPPDWAEGLDEREKEAVHPFLARIFADDPKGEGTLLAQLARALEEVT